MKVDLKLILVTLASSLLVGYIAAYCGFLLDPGGTGGSILAFPVIAAVTVLSIGLFIGGLVTFSRKPSPYLLASSVVVSISFSISLGLV